jgi:2'-5' RNA ligase
VVNSFRTFIAIELPRDLRARIVEYIDKLRRELPDVRASWLREDNLHLTLKFLGDVPVADIPKLSHAVEAAAHTVNPFELVVGECGAFPPHGQPKVLWIGVSEPPAVAGGPDTQASSLQRAHAPGAQVSSLHYLYSALEDECSAAGFPRDDRPFHPHLTIARLRSPKGTRPLADLHKRLGFPPQSFIVSEVFVFRSELLKEGSKHTAISRHVLH